MDINVNGIVCGVTVEEQQLLYRVVDQIYNQYGDDFFVDENGYPDHSKEFSNFDMFDLCVDRAADVLSGDEKAQFSVLMKKLRNLGRCTPEWESVIEASLPTTIYGY